MNWSDIEAAWTDLSDRILADWPELDAGQVHSSGGDLSRFTEYLAATYDLTVAEAIDTIETWCLRLGASV